MASQEKDKKECIPPQHLATLVPPSVPDFRTNFMVCELVLQIETQNSFSGRVYDKLAASKSYFPPNTGPMLTRQEFVRMWKKCLWQRSLDLKRRLTGKSECPDVLPTLPALPVPLAQLLKSLGHLRCPYTGVTVVVVPPRLDPERLPEWAAHDEQLLNKWNEFMKKIGHFYTSRNPYKNPNAESEGFPDIDDCEGKSIGLTAMKPKVENGRISVRSASCLATRSDLGSDSGLQRRTVRESSLPLRPNVRRVPRKIRP